MTPIIVERSRGLFRVTGKDPVGMIHGLATADIRAVSDEQAAYTTFLTPRGRMVADARVFLLPGEATRNSPGPSAGGSAEAPNASATAAPPSLLLDVDPAAAQPLLAHIQKFVPPLFARAEDVSGAWAVVGVYGPGADEVAADAARSLGASVEWPSGAVEERVVHVGDGFAVRTLVTGDEGWDLFVAPGRREAAVDALLEAGGQPGDPEALEALRVSAGRPRWGRELTPDVIPLEAGLLHRAISQSKGCYTGQEVIVRILHRGHVNRYLRRLEFAGTAPAPGTELYEPGGDRPRGVVTSAVENEAGAIGLGYVRREIEPPAELSLGTPDGDRVLALAID